MRVIRETEKGLLLEKCGVQFWVQKRWVSGITAPAEDPAHPWRLTPAGVKAYAIAAREHWRHFGFDARRAFETIRETDKAVLLRCAVELPHAGEERAADFWLPKAKATDWAFVKMKLGEVLERFPFVGARVKGFAA
jgi:hypothetical protein